MDRFHCAPLSYSLVFAREMTLDETELKIHLKKFGLRGGARQPMASALCGTTMQDPWLRSSSYSR